MKCYKHPQNDAAAYCHHCGRALCTECKHEVRGVIYCEECLAARMGAPGLPPVLGQGPSPGVALALGFIPGVGAIYNGQVMKAMLQVLLFGTLIALGDRVGGPMDTIFGLGAAAFYFYMVIDSYQTAKSKQLGQPAPEWFGLGDTRLNACCRGPVGAALLIGLGVLFLLDNLGIPVIHQLGRFWPVLLIVFGLLLLQRRRGRGETGAPANAERGGGDTQGPGAASGPQSL